MLAFVFAALLTVQGRLPAERIDTARGLINDRVTHITTDSRGFLWFGTRDGASRFDGQRFVHYTTAEGLPSGFVTTIIEARGGAMYIATLKGLARLDPGATRGKELLTIIGRDSIINDVVQDAHGRIWAACDELLCEVRGDRLERAPYGGAEIQNLAADRNGRLWAGTKNGLLVRDARGIWTHYAVDPQRGEDVVHGFSIDPHGRLWIGTGFGVFITTPEQLRSPLIQHLPFTRLATRDKPIVHCRTPFHTRDATWVPTSIGVFRIDANGAQRVDEHAGLFPGPVNVVAQDIAGNLWFGSDLLGAMRVARSGITTFTRAQGLRSDHITSVFDDGNTVCATSETARFLQCFDGDRLRVQQIVPPEIEFAGWGWGNLAARDRNGELWVASAQGVVRWSADLQRVIAIYDSDDGLGGDDVFRLWIDSRGDLWLGTFGARVLTRRDHATGKFITYGESDGVPLVAPTAFAEDRNGNIWIGLFTGGLLRFDGKRFTRFDDVPKGFVHDLHVDARGVLWVAANGGVGTIPRIRPDDTTRGALSLAELRDGRMVIGTPRGLELLDVKSGRVTRLTTADGLAHNEAVAAHVDRSGALWLATAAGLSRLTDTGNVPIAPPRQPRIDAVDGLAIPDLGLPAANVRLEYPRTTVSFSAPDFDLRHPVQFEYRLASDARWTPAGTRRSVTYERLPFGEPRFEVRTVAADGRRSPPATVAMHVIPPVYRRWWFLALACAVVVGLALALHRMRVAHLLALQEMRMRVATDLHDDLGSSLSRISILSEVAKRGNERVLDEIGDTARGLVDALGDSIWSIDPRRDDLQSVLARVRHFAADVLEAKSIAMDFDVPPSLATLQLTPEKRRELFLILKEAINNAAKHSGASRLAVAAQVEGSRLRVRIEDDGSGLAENRREGHGLPSMAARAERTGGTLVIGSTPGAGTRIDVAIPI